jgi:hypothetical protein
MSGVIQELPLPYLAELNSIMECFHQKFNSIAYSMFISPSEFPCLWAKAVNMAAYLKTRRPHKHLSSSTTTFKCCHSKMLTIASLKVFRSKCYIYIREEEHFSRSKLL